MNAKPSPTTAPSPSQRDGWPAEPQQVQALEIPELGAAVGEGTAGLRGHGEPLHAGLTGANSPLRSVKTRLTVCVGRVEVTLGELLDAKENHLLRLDTAVDQPVDLLLEGHVIARGTLVAVDEHFGVRISELPSSVEAPAGARKP
jgi:flagellar motor switch protein FliN/FliY